MSRSVMTEPTEVRMEKGWFSVKLCEPSVGVDGSDGAVTFRLSL